MTIRPVSTRAISRRTALNALGHLALAGSATVIAAGCGDAETAAPAIATTTRPDQTAALSPTQMAAAPTPTSAPARSRATQTIAEPTPTRQTALPATTPAISEPPPKPACVLTPQQTGRPFALSAELLRYDITGGAAGTPLLVAFQVVEAGSCAALPDAAVEVWHADARGAYSGFAGQGDRRDLDMSGERFLCGTQITDADGWVEFNSVYPGWYSSRAAHIHFTVSLGDGRTATSQMYFPEHVNTSAFAGPLTTRVTRVPSPTERTSSLVAI